MPRGMTRTVRHRGRCRPHRRREVMRAHRCRVWHMHMDMLRRARRSHRHNATVTRMHCPHRHSIAIAPFRHDLDQCKCVAAIHRMHDTAGVAARNRSLLHRAVTGTRSARSKGVRRSTAIGRRPIPIRKRTIDSNAAPAISARSSARRRAPAAAGGRASACCRTSGGRGRTARRSWAAARRSLSRSP